MDADDQATTPSNDLEVKTVTIVPTEEVHPKTKRAKARQIASTKQPRQRAVVNKWRVEESNGELDIVHQRATLDELCQTLSVDELTSPACSRMLGYIRAKMTGYRHQDVLKHRFNPTVFIALKELVAMLHASQLKCFYCSTDVYILYKNVRESMQWTLDRIDNQLGHNCGNAVISCLACNLSRRCINHRAFEFVKQMRIIKAPAEASLKEVGDDIEEEV